MTDERSGRLSLPYMHAGQAQKEVAHNEALALLDIIVAAGVESTDLSAPPASPTDGQCWIVAGLGTGAWGGQGGRVAGWTQGGWRFVAPPLGTRIWVADRGYAMIRTATGWEDDAVRPDGIYIAGDRIIGARGDAIADPSGGAVIDAEARASITAILDMMRSHGLLATA